MSYHTVILTEVVESGPATVAAIRAVDPTASPEGRELCERYGVRAVSCSAEMGESLEPGDDVEVDANGEIVEVAS